VFHGLGLSATPAPRREPGQHVDVGSELEGPEVGVPRLHRADSFGWLLRSLREKTRLWTMHDTMEPRSEGEAIDIAAVLSR